MDRRLGHLVVAVSALVCAACSASPASFDVAESFDYSTCRVERVTYASGPLRITGWVITPKGSGPFPILIWNHGSNLSPDRTLNLETPSWQQSLGCEEHLTNGVWILFLPEGRGYAGSEGPRLTEIKDSDAVVDFLHGRASDVNAGIAVLEARPEARKGCTVIMGASHGGVVALLAAGERPYRAVIAQATGMSFQDPLLGMKDLVEAAVRSGAPILLQHATNDTLIPPVASRTLADDGQRAGANITLQEYPGVPGLQGHLLFTSSPLFPSTIWKPDFDLRRDQALDACR